MKILKFVVLAIIGGIMASHFNASLKLMFEALQDSNAGYYTTMQFVVWSFATAVCLGLILRLMVVDGKPKSNTDATLIRALRTQTNEAQKNMELSKVLIARLDAFNELWIIHPNGMVELKNAFIRDETVELSTPGTGGPAHKNVHADDHAVDMFAAAMKAKLALKREQGASGWEIAEPEMLEFRLAEQANKPHIDPIDVANYAAFLWNRN